MSGLPRWRLLARLDAQIASLEQEQTALDLELADLEAELAVVQQRGPHVPSQRRLLLAWWRDCFIRGRHWTDDPVHFFENKLSSYRWARSHGIDHPPLHGVWATIEEIPWDDLPDEVVVKCAHSHASRGVLPMRRVPGGWQVVTEQRIQTSADLAARLATLVEGHRRFAGPFFAEALLTDPHDPDRKPMEVKSFTYDGEISYVVLRHSLDHHDTGAVRFRYLTEDLEPIEAAYRNTVSDHTLPIPDDLPRAVAAIRTLSSATRRPCARVDLYLNEGRLVFGELTALPNRWSVLAPAWDERAGALWEAAERRITADALAGRGLLAEWGDGARTLLRSEDTWLGGVPGYE
ncbi:ATP-grasp fold amidoligase family protein [Aeromicrobium stalagmiti]|uniref:ATP-grasp fold amidoligase family protein n=1 Tax=Aeromicrobium stalagmiti TaxID=2738988 RepID=UPI0015689DD0|nr:hypothetical protein [Aeromicrobium stalagmiti]